MFFGEICMKALPVVLLFFLIYGYIYPDNFDDALKLYKEGSYRRSIALLDTNSSLTPIGIYLLGRDYQELKDYKNASEEFSKITPDSFNIFPESGFFRDNYIYFFSLVLNTFQTNNQGITGLFNRLDPGSIYYDDVFKIYLLYEWRTGNFDLLAKLKQTNSSAIMYRTFSYIVQGKHDLFSNIFNFIDEKDFNIVFTGITNLIGQNDLDRIPADRLIPSLGVFYKFNMDDKAGYLLNRYAQYTNDEDLIFRNRLFLLCRKGDFAGAMKLFDDGFNRGKYTADIAEFFSSILQEHGRNGEAYLLLRKVMEKYPLELASDWIRVLDKLHKPDELYAWVKDLKGGIDEGGNRRIFRILLQNNRAWARNFALAMLKKNENDGYFLYVNALFDLIDGDNSSAYSSFLKVYLYHPFTFEGIVSGNYESSLRSSFSNIYNSEIADFRKNNIHMAPADRLSSFTALNDTEFSTDKSRLENDFREELSKTFSDDAGIIPMKWFSFVNRGLLSYNHEIFNILERRITDPLSRYKAALNYGDFYRALGLDGVALARLNIYITKLCGGREYYPLLDEKLKKALYPLLYFDDVLAFSKNTNDALWSLSVFREESHFNKSSISPVGAAGLAQLMPATADIIKKNMKKEEYDCYDFRDNLEIGAFHLNYLFRKYRHNYPCALAAYNAGEPAANRWKKKYLYDNELWIECLDYEESRDYIKRIVQTRYFYSLFYGYGRITILTN